MFAIEVPVPHTYTAYNTNPQVRKCKTEYNTKAASLQSHADPSFIVGATVTERKAFPMDTLDCGHCATDSLTLKLFSSTSTHQMTGVKYVNARSGDRGSCLSIERLNEW